MAASLGAIPIIIGAELWQAYDQTCASCTPLADALFLVGIGLFLGGSVPAYRAGVLSRRGE